MSRQPAQFEFHDEFVAYLAATGVTATPDDYVWWMNAISKHLNRRIGPAELNDERGVQKLLAEVRSLDAKFPNQRLLTNAGSANNLQSILRKYAKMVQANFGGVLEHVLDHLLRETYQRAGRETGYWGKRFLAALNRKGALVTAKQMLRPTGKMVASPGLQSLIDAGRTDLSVESAVLRPEFRSLFTQEELGEAQRRLNGLPAYVRRRPVPPESNFPDEIEGEAEFTEGAKKQVTVNAYERNPAARTACLAKHGYRCSVCGMSFEQLYGEIGRGFIHVHHKKPVAARRGEYKLNPRTDMSPVCPNCHAMLHTANPPRGIDELKLIMEQQRKAAS